MHDQKVASKCVNITSWRACDYAIHAKVCHIYFTPTKCNFSVDHNDIFRVWVRVGIGSNHNKWQLIMSSDWCFRNFSHLNLEKHFNRRWLKCRTETDGKNYTHFYTQIELRVHLFIYSASTEHNVIAYLLEFQLLIIVWLLHFLFSRVGTYKVLCDRIELTFLLRRFTVTYSKVNYAWYV